MTTSTQLPKCWADVQLALDAGIDRVILFGPPGTGKTYAGMNFGEVNRGAFRVICTDDMTNSDITGHMVLNEKGTFSWVNGKALKAWQGDGKLGGRLVIDEIDKAGSDVYATLLNITDSTDSASWTDDLTNTTYNPRPGFSVVMTTNIEQMEDLPEALKDRFPVAIRINQPHPDGLKRLSPDLRGYAVRMADAGDQRISLRSFMAFDELRAKSDEATAARIIFRERANEIIEAIKIDRLSLPATATASDGSQINVQTLTATKGRGRPKGSKNKPKESPF
jgi:MoxR-like ATPase